MKPKKLKEVLKEKLNKEEINLLPRSFDIIGDILIFSKFPETLKKKEKIIGEEILKIHKNIKVVLKKVKEYSGKYRLPKFKIIVGENRKETLHKENNVKLKLDVEKVYFTPRLSNERKRIATLVKPNEKILVMFSGCAPYPCVLAKNTKAREIYAIELNPIAHSYAKENIKLNKISNVKLFNGDVNVIIPKLKQSFDRIIMPLPKGGETFLDTLLPVIKKGTIIHFYNFSTENKIEEIKEKLKHFFKKEDIKIKILNVIKCGHYSPHTYRFCIDFMIITKPKN